MGVLAVFVFEGWRDRLPRSGAARKIDGVSPSLRVGLGVLSVAACTPDLEPPWLVTRPRELALDVEVVEQGPYGAPIAAGRRTARDALPLDTVRLRPGVVDGDGPIDAEGLEGTWLMCAGINSCLLQGTIADRPACTGEELQPSEPCRFFDGGTAWLTLADLSPALVTASLDVLDVLDVIGGPTVSFVGSTSDGPGVDACLARFDARERLDGCLLMERALGLGPLGELVDVLTALGIDPGIGEGAETLLARPRNRNPAVEHFRVQIGDDDDFAAPAGSVVAVPPHETIVVTLATADVDLDAYEVPVGDETAVLSDELTAQWWLDREVELDIPPYGQLWVRLRPGSITGRVRAYAALRDSRGGEAWGWLELEIEQ